MEKITEEYKVKAMTRLEEVIPQYQTINNQYNTLGKTVKSLSTEIKDLMGDIDMDSYEVDGIKAKVTHVQSVSFDDELLLATIKDLGLNHLIKTKEYVDMAMLESAIYRKEIDAQVLAPTQIIKEQIRLNVTGKKNVD